MRLWTQIVCYLKAKKVMFFTEQRRNGTGFSDNTVLLFFFLKVFLTNLVQQTLSGLKGLSRACWRMCYKITFERYKIRTFIFIFVFILFYLLDFHLNLNKFECAQKVFLTANQSIKYTLKKRLVYLGKIQIKIYSSQSDLMSYVMLKSITF